MNVEKARNLRNVRIIIKTRSFIQSLTPWHDWGIWSGLYMWFQLHHQSRRVPFTDALLCAEPGSNPSGRSNTGKKIINPLIITVKGKHISCLQPCFFTQSFISNTTTFWLFGGKQRNRPLIDRTRAALTLTDICLTFVNICVVFFVSDHVRPGSHAVYSAAALYWPNFSRRSALTKNTHYLSESIVLCFFFVLFKFSVTLLRARRTPALTSAACWENTKAGAPYSRRTLSHVIFLHGNVTNHMTLHCGSLCSTLLTEEGRSQIPASALFALETWS